LTIEKSIDIFHNMKRLILINLILALFLAGCVEEEEDTTISQITIFNIPASIPMVGGSGSNPTYKIYLNASDSQAEEDPPVAKGIALMPTATESNGTYTVTIDLKQPNTPEQTDPNAATGPWSGTARYFSLMISPATKTDTEGWNRVWVKAGTGLNKGKERLDWNNTTLMDFRTLVANDPTDTMGFLSKLTALFNSIIINDSQITYQGE
jgi:hypothetical protein